MKDHPHRISFIRAAQAVAGGALRHDCQGAKRCFSCMLAGEVEKAHDDFENRKISREAFLDKLCLLGSTLSLEVGLPEPYVQGEGESAKAAAELAAEMGFPKRAALWYFMQDFYDRASELLEACRIEEQRRKPIDAQDPAKN